IKNNITVSLKMNYRKVEILKLNITVKIDSPDIANGIITLANELSKLSLEKEDIKVEVKKADTATTLEQVRARLAALSKEGKQAEVKALITKYGADKLSEISPEKYSDLLKEAEEI